jgi:hypothetical protein
MDATLTSRWILAFKSGPSRHLVAQSDLMPRMAIQFPDGKDCLPPGRHQISEDEVEGLLVDAFPNSTRRRLLYEQWRAVREGIRRIVSVEAEWLNGSYVTKKVEPDDIDMVTILSPEVDELDAADRALLSGLVARHLSEQLHGCHSFALVAYPEDHPNHESYLTAKAYFEKLFGHDRDGAEKGFLEVV